MARFLRSQNRPLLVVVDQFEELLATGERPDQDLLNLLLPPPDAADAAVRLVLDLARGLPARLAVHSGLSHPAERAAVPAVTADPRADAAGSDAPGKRP